MKLPEKPQRFHAVIFDLDDTLLDSFPLRLGALKRTLAQADISTPTALSVFTDLKGTSLEASLDKLEVNLGKSLGLYKRYLDDMFSHWLKEPQSVSLFPGVKEMLVSLRADGINLAVVTQKRRSFQFNGMQAGAYSELKELRVADMFVTVIGNDDVIKPKPDPEAILLALSRLYTASAETLVVGDTYGDIIAGNSAGCTTCLATWGRLPSQTEPVPSNFTAKSPADVIKLVRPS